MNVADIRIEEWNKQFLVTGQFGGMFVLASAFDSYRDALKELIKIAQREEIRYESGIGYHPNR